MEKDYERKRLRLEADYWLFKARRELILQLIKNHNFGPRARILDIGCSGGHLLNLLKKNGFKEITGIDISKKAVESCRKKGIKNVFQSDAQKTKFKSKTFDLVIAADILEHLENEQRALREWQRILKGEGKLIITVPAFNFLWSQHDEALHHLRRYSKPELIKALKRANFTVEKNSYWNFILFFPASLLKISQRKGDQLYELNPLVNKILFCLLKFENWLLMKSDFPIGISVFGVAKNPQKSFRTKKGKKD